MRIEIATDCERLLATLQALQALNPNTAWKFGWVGLQTFAVYENTRLPRNHMRIDRYGEIVYYFLDANGRLMRMEPAARDAQPVQVHPVHPANGGQA